jgi:hypothetical protein
MQAAFQGVKNRRCAFSLKIKVLVYDFGQDLLISQHEMTFCGQILTVGIGRLVVVFSDRVTCKA